MKLADLFYNCAYVVNYEQAGSNVSYAFVENKKDETLYIYFQGSYEKIDWIRNFLFFPKHKKPYKDMDIPYKVHGGFLEAWKEVEDIIINKVTQRRTREPNWKEMQQGIELVNDYVWKHIFVIGYSHGGALAALCHECVWFWRPDLRKSGLEGYGFEAPRVYAGYKVRKELEERWEHFTVIRTNGDLVTHMPPWLFGFCHVGNMIKTKGDTSLVKEWYIPRCIKSHYPQVVLDGLNKLGK